MDEKDEKLLSLIDLIVVRDEVTNVLHSPLKRLARYFEHQELMQQIDFEEVLLEDLRDLLKVSYNEAMSKVASQANSSAFQAQYEKLSEEGKDAYWAGNIEIDCIPKHCLPWFDIIAARQRQLAARR